MNSKQRLAIWLLVLILMAPSMASAVRKGRLVGTVLDPDGKPVADVTIVATCESVPSFREIETTNKRGVFKLDFDYLDVIYNLVFSKNGYHTFTSEQTWSLEGKTLQEFLIHPGEDTVDGAPIASTSSEAVSAYNAGVDLYNTKDMDAAEAKFLEALEHDPELHQAWAALSKIYIKQEQYQKAVDATEKAIALGSTDEDVWRARWDAYRNLGDEVKTAEALDDLEKAGLRKEEARLLHNDAVALTKTGDYEAAFDMFEKALEVDPNSMSTLLGFAMTAGELGRHKEATEAAKKILNAEPDHEQAIRIRFNATLELGEEEEIAGALIGLALLEPVIARDNLLKMAFDAYDEPDMERAKNRFKDVLTVDANHALSHYYLALIYVNESDNEKAKPHLSKFLELDPDHPEAATAQALLDYLNES